MNGFHNRRTELEQLDARFAGARAEMVVLYGRRRIGKTALLRAWLERHRGEPQIHWTAHRTTSSLLLEGFSEALRQAMPDLGAGFRFADWEGALGQLFVLGAKRRLAAVIDEFPYLVECAPEIPSLLQKLWDRHQGSSRLMLVLCGSHYHMMNEQFASHRQPLYGRATGRMLVEEIAPEDLGLFLPRYSPRQLVETYGVLGGVPAYLEQWDDRAPVLTNVERRVLAGDSFLSQEALLLIHDEIAEPRTYFGLMEALGANLRTPAELARASGVAINHVGKYLRTLVDLHLVSRVLSGEASDREHTRMTRYEIRDSFLRFYFQFLYPNWPLLQQGRVERLREIVNASFESYVGRTAYEELARRRVARLGDAGALPFRPDYVGRAWNRAAELDVVAVNWRDRTVLFGECKWRREKMDAEDLRSLQERARRLPGFAGFKQHWALFSRSGFAPALLKAPERAAGLLLFQDGDLASVD